jgi:phytoene dehydrogenase-like protein
MSDDALQYDTIIIGAGHNGLVAAGYMAKAGKRVVVLDQGVSVGGAARTEEISPDYQISNGAHLVSRLPKRVEKDLKLAKHGLIWATKDVVTVALDQDGKHIVIPAGGKTDIQTLGAHSSRDGEAWPRFDAQLKKFISVLAPFLDDAMPETGPDISGRVATAAALRLEKMGPRDLQAFLRFVPASIATILDRFFDGELLKGALALDATLGHHSGPNSPGSAFTFLYERALQSLGQGTGYPIGGVGALSEALAASAESAGVKIRLDSTVAEIVVGGGRVSGVRLMDGTVFKAPVVMSSADPKTTCLDLLGARHLEASLSKQVGGIRMQGAAAKINLALEGLPKFANFSDREYGGRLLVAPDMATVERSFIAAKRNELTLDPVMEMVIPSYHDPRLAPMGHHVLSIVVPNVPYDVEGGWDDRREELVKRVIDTIALYAPDIKEKIIAGDVLTPPEIEEKFGMKGGHWHQGDMSFDQLLTFRPAPGMAGYETPVDGLYLCGAGTHPGGGISGLPGKYAATAALEAEKGQ